MRKNQSKKNKNKLFATSMAATFAASAVAPIVTSAAVKDFPDVPKTHKYYNAIQDLVSAGVVKGYEDGRFKTEGYVTRAEAAVMVSTILKLEKTAPTPFKDVKKGMWYEVAVNKLYTAGIIKGVTETTFQPNKTMTRAQLSQLIVEAYKIKGSETMLPFNDVKMDKWYQSPIKVLYSQGLIKGQTEKTFGPENNIKRGDFAWLLANTDYKFGNTLKPTPPKDAQIESIGTVGDMTILVGDKVSLPTVVAATYDNKTTKNVNVIWNADQFDFTQPGTYNLTGTIKDTNKTATAKIIVKAKATAVTTISRDHVAFTIPETKEVVKNFTIDVTDNTGKLVEVYGVDLVKGETQVTLMFKTPLTTDPVGVWTVGTVTYNNDATQNFKDIMTAVLAINPNEVETLKLLKQSGITGLLDGNITEYVTALATDQLNGNLNDVQRIINQVNDTTISTGDAEMAIKAVNTAKTQVQLLNALENRAFSRVNKNWIVAYDKITALKTGKSIANIQKEIDLVNIAAIETAKSSASTVAQQNTVTELIKMYIANDMIGEVKKADQLKASETLSAIFSVKEAKTAASIYDALMKVSALDPIGLPVSSLNANLGAEYLVARGNFANLITNKITVAELNGAIVAANQQIESVVLKEIDKITTGTSLADLKVNLQKLAAVTSHLGYNGFDISKVNEANLTEYRAALAKLNNPTQADITKAIYTVNSASSQATNLDMIKNSTATVSQVRDALTEIANGAIANKTTTDYLNASSQTKLEIAQYVVDNRAKLASTLTADLVTALTGSDYNTAVILTAQTAQKAQVAKFNRIGNLDIATISTTKAALDNYAYGPYVALSATQKIDVAEELNKLTKPTSAIDATPIKLDFSSADGVYTQVQANAYIDEAIVKVTK